MIPLKTKVQNAIRAIGAIIAREYTLTEILDALEEIEAEIEIMIEAVRDDVERKVNDGA